MIVALLCVIGHFHKSAEIDIIVMIYIIYLSHAVVRLEIRMLCCTGIDMYYFRSISDKYVSCPICEPQYPPLLASADMKNT